MVTKCDLISARYLAKRLTVMKEILDGEFKGAAGPIIPVSAKKRQGVDEIRKVGGRLSGGLDARF